MTRFMDLLRKRARRLRAQRFHDQMIKAGLVWGPFVGIEDLSDPTGKRFLFDDFEGMPQQSTLEGEAIPAHAEVPLRGNLPGRPSTPGEWGCVRERICVPICPGCARTTADRPAPAEPF